MSGSGIGEAKHQKASNLIMTSLLDSKDAHLALDDEGIVQAHYEKQCNPDTFARRWLRELADKDKLHIVKRCMIDKATRTALSERKFVGEDLNKYVRTAGGSTSRHLTSHDKHYTAKVRKILRKRLEVTFLALDDAAGYCED
jgi:hypothetical protein